MEYESPSNHCNQKVAVYKRSNICLYFDMFISYTFNVCHLHSAVSLKHDVYIVKFVKTLYQRSSNVVYMIIAFYLKLVDLLPEAICLVFTLGPDLFNIVT